MSTTRPGWLDEPGHDEPVELGQALAEWAAGHARADEPGPESEAGQ
jgi:hypothetical protein